MCRNSKYFTGNGDSISFHLSSEYINCPHWPSTGAERSKFAGKRQQQKVEQHLEAMKTCRMHRPTLLSPEPSLFLEFPPFFVLLIKSWNCRSNFWNTVKREGMEEKFHEGYAHTPGCVACWGMRLEGNIWQCKIPALIQSDKSCGRVAGLGVRKRRSRVRDQFNLQKAIYWLFLFYLC